MDGGGSAPIGGRQVIDTARYNVYSPVASSLYRRAEHRPAHWSQASEAIHGSDSIDRSDRSIIQYSNPRIRLGFTTSQAINVVHVTVGNVPDSKQPLSQHRHASPLLRGSCSKVLQASLQKLDHTYQVLWYKEIQPPSQKGHDGWK